MVMRKLLNWLTPRKIARTVESGRVYCPVRAADIDVDHCLTCPFLEVALGNSRVTEIRCTPTLGSLVGSAAGL
jgi:hypothetical protein